MGTGEPTGTDSTRDGMGCSCFGGLGSRGGTPMSSPGVVSTAGGTSPVDGLAGVTTCRGGGSPPPQVEFSYYGFCDGDGFGLAA